MKSKTYEESDRHDIGHFSGHIRAEESDQLVKRLLEVIGDEPLLAFSRRCGIGEGTLRNVIKTNASPRTEHMVAIADAANVTVEWLATGRPPKWRKDLLAALDAVTNQAQASAPLGDRARLATAVRAVEEGLAGAKLTMPPAKKAELICAAYDLITENTPKNSAQIVQLIRLVA